MKSRTISRSTKKEKNCTTRKKAKWCGSENFHCMLSLHKPI